MQKKLPFTKQQIEKIIQKYQTPFHIYDEKAIRENVRKLYKTFDWIDGFKNYFAVKANPNPHLIKILKEEKCGTDCSSMSELKISEMVGITNKNIMFTANDTPAEEFKKAAELGAIINFDDITHINYFIENVGPLPELISFRYNPGPLKKGNDIIGNPEDAKYGFTKEQLFEGYKILIKNGVKRFGLHTMLASNEINTDYFIETIQILFDLARKIEEKLEIKFELINIGGGIGIPYKPDQTPVDIQYISNEMKKIYEQNKLTARIVMEMGRMITGPFGYLITKAIHEKHIYKEYIGVDACMANLMRPALYGAYHHITVLGKEDEPPTQTYDIVGSLCENNDKFAIDRKLPKININDILVIHDTGAHGHAMGFNYNGKLRSAELLLCEDKSVKQIRRAETFEDYIATVEF